METKNDEKINDAMTPAEAGLSLRIISGPVGAVDKEEKREWPHILFEVELCGPGGSTILRTPYKLGVGHVDPKKTKLDFRLADTFGSMLSTWAVNPGADFIDKQKHADLAAILARKQNVAPTLDDVAHSCLLDGAAFFDGETFEDWAGNYGYDSDSRKAFKTWQECDEKGRKLQRALGADKIRRLREWASNL